MALHIVTFGQTHTHSIDGKTFDKDCLAMYNCDNYGQGRKIAFKLFGDKFGTSYCDHEFKIDQLRYFPRGIIPIDHAAKEAVLELEQESNAQR